MEPVSISCDECRLQATEACDDCVVTFLCSSDDAPVSFRPDVSQPVLAQGGGAVIVDAAEARAVRMLQQAGLLPQLRFERRVG